MRTAELKTRVGVYFDQPGLEISVDHEVQSQELKVVLPPVAV